MPAQGRNDHWARFPAPHGSRGLGASAERERATLPAPGPEGLWCHQLSHRSHIRDAQSREKKMERGSNVPRKDWRMYTVLWFT